MKILTLNAHSLVEPDYEKKLALFAQVVWREKPDIMAFQEASQSLAGSPLPDEEAVGYQSVAGYEGRLHRDNYGANLAGLLKNFGLDYFWTWVPAKLGYDIYEEGLAIFTRKPVMETDQFTISAVDDYHNWKTRKIVGLRNEDGWFYSVHMGWWKDEEEPFSAQWKCVAERLARKKNQLTERQGLWLMGDFNSPASVRGEGYDLVCESGWSDTYLLAKHRDKGSTASGGIDGWKDGESESGMRIDYIWHAGEVSIASSQVICDGKKYPQVSDHCGVMIETESGAQE